MTFNRKFKFTKNIVCLVLSVLIVILSLNGCKNGQTADVENENLNEDEMTDMEPSTENETLYPELEKDEDAEEKNEEDNEKADDDEKTEEEPDSEAVKYEVVNCRESITLRKEPNTKAGEYCQIPLGAEVIFVDSAENGFYQVIYNGMKGYALSYYLQEEENEEAFSKDQFIVLQDPQMYSYLDMEIDLFAMQQAYADLMSVEVLGVTADGRKIYDIVIGDKNAKTQCLLTSGIHGREYISSQLAMKQAVIFLWNLKNDSKYGEVSYSELLKDCALHIIPMVNPDGITISQFGLEGLYKETTKEQVKKIASMDSETAEGYYLKRWKANANGVDLNRNFDALWELYGGAGHPSSDTYKGEDVGCEVESAALISLTEKYKFARTISYHTQGSVIYWYFGQSGALYEETLEFAERIASLTGYYTDANYEKLDPAGYKDWAISKLQIPSLTVEIGRDTSPVPPEQFNEIWRRNRYVLETMILDAK